MISAANAKTDSQSTLSSLSYVNSLILTASDKGLFRIFVDSPNMNDDLMSTLISTYGYKVTKKTDNYSTYSTYLIDWFGVSTPTITSTPTSTPTPTQTPSVNNAVAGEFIYTAQTGIAWNGYGSNYLSFGRSQDGTNKTPLAGWYFKDSNNVVRQLLNTPVWFSNGNPSPWPNGNGWIAVANGSFSISASQTTITFYETSPA
jgi:hypothetical protein